MNPVYRTLLATAVLLSVSLFSAGPVTAQLAWNPTTVTVMIDALEAPVGAETIATGISGVYSGTAGVSTTTTTITLSLEEYPPWIEAVISPSTIQVSVLGALQGGQAQFNIPFTSNLVLRALSGAPEDLTGKVVVRAIAHPNFLLAASEATDSTLVATAASDDCPDGPVAIVAGEGAADTAPTPEPTEVETQSAAIAPATAPVVGGLALLGAVGGGAYVLRRRAMP